MDREKRDKLKANVGSVFDMVIAPTVLELIADLEQAEEKLSIAREALKDIFHAEDRGSLSEGIAKRAIEDMGEEMG